MDDSRLLAEQIKEYSDLLGAILVKDIKQMLSEEFTNLSTKQILILDLIKDGPKTIKDISEYLAITASAASQLVSKLEKDGYLQRDINKSNRREILVSLDHQGRAYQEELSHIDQVAIDKYYLPLGKDDLEKLLDLYKKIHQIALATGEG